VHLTLVRVLDPDSSSISLSPPGSVRSAATRHRWNALSGELGGVVVRARRRRSLSICLVSRDARVAVSSTPSHHRSHAEAPQLRGSVSPRLCACRVDNFPLQKYGRFFVSHFTTTTTTTTTTNNNNNNNNNTNNWGLC